MCLHKHVCVAPAAAFAVRLLTVATAGAEQSLVGSPVDAVIVNRWPAVGESAENLDCETNGWSCRAAGEIGTAVDSVKTVASECPPLVDPPKQQRTWLGTD